MPSILPRRLTSVTAICLAAGAWAGPTGIGTVHAAPANGFEVSATVAAECVVGNTTAMSFGNLRMLSQSGTGGLTTFNDTATATFDAACTNGTANPTLKFTSTNGNGQFQMAGPDAVKMAYNLFEGNATTVQIAHDTDAAFTGFDADGTVKSLTVTGQVTPAQKSGKPVGTYNDLVIITVGFTPS